MLSADTILGELSGRTRPGGDADGFGPSDHVCWPYPSDQERARAATAWLSDGLRRGQRGVYVGDDSVDNLVAQLDALPGLDDKLAGGEVLVFAMSDLYDLSAPIDADVQLSAYAGAVEQALADGFHGLRVAADITRLVIDPTRRPAHVHWEQVADRYISENPLAPLCMYDSRRITGLEAIAHCHPLQGAAAACGFYAMGSDSAALAGAIDIANQHVLVELLSAQPRSDRAVDVADLEFIDGRAAWLLHEHLLERRASGHTLTLTGANPTLQRIWGVCGFDPALLRIAPPAE
jgi:anti-anti-sigma regulatory factor